MSYRSIAGNLEMFSGAYFVAFGTLAAIYFNHMHRPHVAMMAGAAALFGLLLLARASRLLGWKRWLFWSVAAVLTTVPIAWFVRPLLNAR